MRAIVVVTPLIAFLAYMRATNENRYVSYTLPILGEFPNAAWFDISAVFAAIAVWLILPARAWIRRPYLGLLIGLGAFVVLFRVVDHYYYLATKSNLNAYVLYTNLTMVQEGTEVVLSAPIGVIATVLVALHFGLYAWSRRYRGAVREVANRIARGPRRPAVAILGALAAILLVNLHALIVHPRRRSVLITASGEYQLVKGLPTFLHEASLVHTDTVRPARVYLPPPAPLGSTYVAPAAVVRRHPDVFVVTVESFNALYTLPAEALHPGLPEDVMPFFRSLSGDGLQFSKAYTSAAYTFNGIIAVLCSQYTVSEVVWGPGCLPDVLERHGYDPFSFISISQLRPFRYGNFETMGFEPSHVFDAVRVRSGKKNVYFDFLTDAELFDYAASVADSIADVKDRPPIFMHLSTNQMHVPGMFRATTCSPYPFPDSLAIDGLTTSMLNSARCTDRDLSNFIGRLKRAGLYDDAVVVVTADHAFNLSFWDHRESELARIPLFLKLPKSLPHPAIDTAQVVGQIDIAPTILDYLGMEAERPMYGRSLLEPVDPTRTVAGVSTSHLLSLASRNGIVFHSRGATDYSATAAHGFSLADAGEIAADSSVAATLDALFDTVVYFDQNPGEFMPTVAADSQSRVAAAADDSAKTTASLRGAHSGRGFHAKPH